VKRFLPNPESHWGPKVRAGRTITSKHISLLGAEAINGAIGHQEANGAVTTDKPASDTGGTVVTDEVNEPSTKRQKTSDGEQPTEP
jgi:tRNA (guanine26-N2/guanine27-N2)-dimethyltransferase